MYHMMNKIKVVFNQSNEMILIRSLVQVEKIQDKMSYSLQVHEGFHCLPFQFNLLLHPMIKREFSQKS